MGQTAVSRWRGGLHQPVHTHVYSFKIQTSIHSSIAGGQRMKQGRDNDVNHRIWHKINVKVHKKTCTKDCCLYKMCVGFHLNGILMTFQTQRLDKTKRWRK